MKYQDYYVDDPSLKPMVWICRKLLELAMFLAERSGFVLNITVKGDYHNLPLQTSRVTREETKLSVTQYKYLPI